MSEYDEGTGENGDVLDFMEIDDDILAPVNKTDISAKQDNTKRSSFVEKTRRISSENAGELEDEVEDRAASARTLGTTATVPEIVEESNYNDVDNDWELENDRIGNAKSSANQASRTASERGTSKRVSPELDFPADEIAENVAAPIYKVSSHSPSSHKAEEVDEAILNDRGKVSAASSPVKSHSVLGDDDVEVEDIAGIHDAPRPSYPSPKFASSSRASAPAPAVLSEQANHSNKNASQDADTRSDSVKDEHQSERGNAHGKGEHPNHKAPAEKRSTAAAKLADAAEKQAMAAEQEKEDKIAALRQRAAKRQEEKERRERKELLREQRREREAADARDGTEATRNRSADGDNDAESGTDDRGELKGKLFLPSINKKVKKADGQNNHRVQAAEDEGLEKNAGWNDDVKADHSDEVKERKQAAQQQRMKDKEERNRLLRARRAKAQEQQSADGGAAVVGEEIPVEAHNLLAPKPPVGRINQHPGRAGRKVAGSANSADDDYGRGVVLPHLNHPRSSPDPRAALHSLLQESEQIGAGLDLGVVADDNQSYNSLSNKARRRKPLYLRMIAKAQQQYLEEERQKHELYSEQKKSKQRGNPTAEELRAHRQKHDELVRNKQEEGKRALAEAAAANARAIKRQQAVASVVQTALDEGGGELVVDGASPNRKAKPQRRSKPSMSKDDGGGISLPALSDHGHTGGPGSNTRDNGFSPKKGSSSSLHSGRSPSKTDDTRSPRSPPSSSGRVKRSSTDPDESEKDSRFGIDSHVGITENGLSLDSTPRRPASRSRMEFLDSDKRPQHTVTMVSVGTDTNSDEPPLPDSAPVPLEFDREAAAAAVQSIPDLDCDALTAYCAPDWMKIFSIVDDLVLIPGDRAEGAAATALVGGKQLFVRGIILGQAPPTLDAQKLMFIDEPIAAE